jgi:hypothetical protein
MLATSVQRAREASLMGTLVTRCPSGNVDRINENLLCGSTFIRTLPT